MLPRKRPSCTISEQFLRGPAARVSQVCTISGTMWHPRGRRPTLDEKKKILVADDDQSIRSLLQTFLESEGFITTEAKAGRDVITSITRHRPDLVIMDVRMPGMSGLDVLDQMKRM